MRLGVFGGTFDPPHIAHMILAEESRYQLGLDRILWVLTPDPPHKPDIPISSPSDRLAMLQIAIAGNPAFELSRIDIDRPPPHYAADTLPLLRKENPETTLVYLIGGDSLHDLPTWHQPEQVVAEADEIGVMRRPGDQIDLPALEEQLPRLKGKLTFVAAPLLQIASHEIRRRAATGIPFRYYLREEVFDYIIERKLYQDLVK